MGCQVPGNEAEMVTIKCQECGYQEEVMDTYELCLAIPVVCQDEGHLVTIQWKKEADNARERNNQEDNPGNQRRG